MRILIRDIVNLRSGMEKVGSRIIHPGSATLTTCTTRIFYTVFCVLTSPGMPIQLPSESRSTRKSGTSSPAILLSSRYLYSSTNIFNIQHERSTSHTMCPRFIIVVCSLLPSNYSILHKVSVTNFSDS